MHNHSIWINYQEGDRKKGSEVVGGNCVDFQSVTHKKAAQLCFFLLFSLCGMHLMSLCSYISASIIHRSSSSTHRSLHIPSSLPIHPARSYIPSSDTCRNILPHSQDDTYCLESLIKTITITIADPTPPLPTLISPFSLHYPSRSSAS